LRPEILSATLGSIKRADDIAPVMKKAFDTAGPVIVGVHVDYRDNHQLFEMIRGNGMH
jgi:acetolactate synthase-1/2/3 large subunit